MTRQALAWARRRTTRLAVGIGISGVLTVAGCVTALRGETPSAGTVTIAVNPWVGYEADAAVVSTILETKLHYTVKLKKQPASESWDDLASGAVDVILENWGHAALKKKLIDEQKIAVSAGSTGNKGVLGWYVPIWMVQDYPDILDWHNLNRYSGLFATAETGSKGQLLEGDKSYVTLDAALIKNLGLNLTLAYSGSEEATVAAAQAATRDRKPLLFYFWEPHYLFRQSRYAKVNLPEYTPGCDADPETVACDYAVSDLDKIVSAKFAAKGGKAYQLVKNFSWTNDNQNEVAEYLAVDKLGYRAAAERWMETHPDDWQPWLASSS